MRACALGAAGASCAAAALVPAAAQGAETATQIYPTKGEYAFVVPSGVTSVQLTLVGGNGGSGRGGAPGGVPATVIGTLAVRPGQTLFAEVAGNGPVAGSAGPGGGFGGGGPGGPVAFGGPGGGGGGGGSDVRTCPAGASPAECGGRASLASRLLVAGGGGGGGGGGEPSPAPGGPGGSGDAPGFEGAVGGGNVGGTGGQRGTLSAGGEAGGPTPECNPKTSEGCALAGQQGLGGAGGKGVIAGGGGGGGGGVFGGGGGGAGGALGLTNGGGGGGGGGASGVPAGAAGVSGFSLVPTATGAQPSITISWTKPAPEVVTGAASAVTSSGATLTGSVNPNNSQVTDCHFTISPAPPAGGSIPCAEQIGAGGVPVGVSASLTGLSPATTYTYTLSASSAQGSSSGAPVAFTTPALVTPGPGAPGAGSAALTVSGLTIAPTRFKRGRGAATIAGTKAKKVPTSTTISFALSQPATVTLSFQAAKSGVLARGKCTAPPKRPSRARRCRRYVTVPGSVRRAAHAGTNRIRFQGILDGGRALAPGSYQLTLIASSGAVATTAAQRPVFTIVR